MNPLDLSFHNAYDHLDRIYHRLLATENLSPTHFYFFCASPNQTCKANSVAARIAQEIRPNPIQVKDFEISRSLIRCYAISQEHSSSFHRILSMEQARRINEMQIFSAQNGDIIVIPTATNIFSFGDF